MEENTDTQMAQATLNLLRHVAMSAPLPVIQALKDQLEQRYSQLIEPLHPGVEFLVKSTLEGDFETILPMVQGLLQTGSSANPVQAIQETLAQAPAISTSSPAPMGSSPALFRGAGKAYKNFFQSNS